MTIFEWNIFWFILAPTYYWLMYALAFIYGLWTLKKNNTYSQSEQESIFLYLFLGVVLWGRIWYIVFYDFWAFLWDPFLLFRIWEWWMSFHWGLIGFSLATYIFARKHKKIFLSVIDDLALIVPVGLFLWRIGNYINKELLWFPYEGFLAVKTSEGNFFPSPLVEAFLEGIVLFFILRFVAKKQRFTGQLWCLFLIFYGVFRSFVEIFIRTPDIQIGYYFGFLTQWSILSIVMIVVWIIIYYFLSNKNATGTYAK